MNKYLKKLDNVIEYAQKELLNKKHAIYHYEVNGFTKEIIIRLTKINNYDQTETWNLVFKLNTIKPKLIKISTCSIVYDKQKIKQGIKDLQA